MGKITFLASVHSLVIFLLTLLLFHFPTLVIFCPINFVLSSVSDKNQALWCFFNSCHVWNNLLMSNIYSSPIFKVGLIFLLWFYNLQKGYGTLNASSFSPPLATFVSELFVFHTYIMYPLKF